MTGSAGLALLALLAIAPLWIAGGIVLLVLAVWPSTCMPADLVETYACSSRLPESGRWQEAMLLTWLWATPLLAGLTLARRASERLARQAAGVPRGGPRVVATSRTTPRVHGSSPLSAAASPRPP